MEIHQLLPSLSTGDAIGSHVIQLRSALRERWPSEIFYERSDPHVADEGAPFKEYLDLPSAASGENALLYHLSIGAAMFDFLLEREEKLLVYYHNITPAHFFAPYDPGHARYLEEGLEQVRTLASRTALAWAPSHFSARELQELGYGRVLVLPLLMDFSRYDAEPDESTMERIRSTKKEGPDILFVGRAAPNKRLEDLVKLLRIYRSHVGSGGRVFMVGHHHHTTYAYSGAVTSFARTLGLGADAVVVGPASMSEVIAYYRSCDVFVSMSEHEGFGAPTLEAMHCGLPVVAYGSSAIPETVGGGGVVLPEKDLLAAALAVDRLFRDPDARQASIASGYRRVAELSPEKLKAQMFSDLDKVL